MFTLIGIFVVGMIVGGGGIHVYHTYNKP